MAKFDIKSKKFTGDMDGLMQKLIDLLLHCQEGVKILPNSSALEETIVFIQNYIFYLLESEYPQEFIINMFEQKRHYYLDLVKMERIGIENQNLN